VAQAVAPDARIVYVDNDPIVLTHALALLASGAEGATQYVDGDLRDTAMILRAAARTLDFTARWNAGFAVAARHCNATCLRCVTQATCVKLMEAKASCPSF
jgi:hypothetical protein